MSMTYSAGPRRTCLFLGYILLMAPQFFIHAFAGLLPAELDFYGDVPEKKVVWVNVYKPPNATNGVVTLMTFNANRKREGKLVINGNTPITLFGSSGVSENSKSFAAITISTPASYWKNGNNKLVFKHTKYLGFSINDMDVVFESTSTTGSEPIAEFSVASLDFGSLDVGAISNPLSLTLSNSGATPMSISGVSISTGFTQENNCSNTIPAGGNCIFDIQFTPDTGGDITGKLRVASDASNSSDFVSLTGTGITNATEYIPAPSQDPASPDIVFYNDLNNETRHIYTHTDLQEFWWYTGKKDLYDAVEIVADPNPSGTRKNAMSVFYAAGIVGRKGVSGTQWPVRFAGYQDLYFAFDVFFEDDAEFVKGGKLPRLQSTGWTGNAGVPADGTDRWSAGLMWRDGGKLTSYVYHANMSGSYGDVRNWNNGPDGQVYFQPGQWHSVEIRVLLNTPGVLDGRMQGWFDGKLALDTSQFMWRMPGGEHLEIGELMFTTFYGGGNSSWAPSTDQHIYFDNIVISTKPITH